MLLYGKVRTKVVSGNSDRALEVKLNEALKELDDKRLNVVRIEHSVSVSHDPNSTKPIEVWSAVITYMLNN